MNAYQIRVSVIGGIILIFILMYPLLMDILQMKVSEGLVAEDILLQGEFLSGVVMGGFKGIASDILWIRADEYWHRGEWHRAMPMYRIITWLQPHFVEAWSLGGWHLAYNMSVYTKDKKQSQTFIKEGLEFLREGITKNPGIYDLYFELGWTYFHKLEDYDNAVKYFKKTVKYERPHYVDRMLAHAYHKKGDLAGEIEQWERCLTLYKDDKMHQDLSRKFLNEAKEKLREKEKPDVEAGH
jgi:tetratricopeptide (TPR) repeat protein